MLNNFNEVIKLIYQTPAKSSIFSYYYYPHNSNNLGNSSVQNKCRCAPRRLRKRLT